MKIATFLLAALFLSFAVAAPAQAQGNKRVLVAYFSHTQTTEKVALEIHKRIGGDIFQIETVQACPDEHQKQSCNRCGETC